MYKTKFPLFLSRIKRVCLFDAGVYRDAGHHFLEALLIVLLVALSHGIGGFIRAKTNNWDPQESFVFGFQGEIVFWLVQSMFFYSIARWLLKKPAKPVELLSAVGFSIIPGILVFAVSLLEWAGLSIPLLVVLAVYRIATCTAALMQVLSLKIGMALLMVVTGTAIGILSLGLVIRITEWLIK